MWIVGKLTYLRPIEPRHITQILKDVALSDLALTTFPLQIPRNEAWFLERYVTPTGENSRRHKFGIVRNTEGAQDEIIGTVDLFEIDLINRSAELGYQIFGLENRRLGIALDATKVAVRWAFSSLNLRRITVRVLVSNEPSIQLAEKLGFSREGRLRSAAFINGKEIDLLIMGLLSSDQKPDADG